MKIQSKTTLIFILPALLGCILSAVLICGMEIYVRLVFHEIGHYFGVYKITFIALVFVWLTLFVLWLSKYIAARKEATAPGYAMIKSIGVFLLAFVTGFIVAGFMKDTIIEILRKMIN